MKICGINFVSMYTYYYGNTVMCIVIVIQTKQVYLMFENANYSQRKPKHHTNGDISL